MKLKLFCFLGMVSLFTSCKPDNYLSDTVVLNITGWSYPDTVKVSTPFELRLRTEISSSCVSSPSFIIENYASDAFRVYVIAKYERYNDNCYGKIVKVDSTLTGNISSVGRYYFLFLKDDDWAVDSIQVIP